MELFKKSKDDEMRRLRAAGFSIAHADRLAKGRRKPGPLLVLAGGVGLLLVGAIAALSLALQPAAPVFVAMQSAGAGDVAVAQPVAMNVAVVDTSSFEIEATDPVDADAMPLRVLSTDLSDRLSDTPLSPLEGGQSFGSAYTAADRAQSTTIASIAAALQKAETRDCVADLTRFVNPLFIQFDLGSTDISPRNAQLLAQIADRVIACPEAHVIVGGHADSSGDDVTNMKISWERADQTLERLVEIGVDPMAVEAVGFGARAPLSEGSSGDEDADRRVDFRVLRERENQP